MKITFVEVDGIEYMLQFDNDNVFFARNNNKDKTRKMVIIELWVGEVREIRVIKSKQIIYLNVLPETRFDMDVRDLVRVYAPIIEKLVFQ